VVRVEWSGRSRGMITTGFFLGCWKCSKIRLDYGDGHTLYKHKRNTELYTWVNFTVWNYISIKLFLKVKRSIYFQKVVTFYQKRNPAHQAIFKIFLFVCLFQQRQDTLVKLNFFRVYNKMSLGSMIKMNDKNKILKIAQGFKSSHKC